MFEEVNTQTKFQTGTVKDYARARRKQVFKILKTPKTSTQVREEFVKMNLTDRQRETGELGAWKVIELLWLELLPEGKVKRIDLHLPIGKRRWRLAD